MDGGYRLLENTEGIGEERSARAFIELFNCLISASLLLGAAVLSSMALTECFKVIVLTINNVSLVYLGG